MLPNSTIFSTWQITIPPQALAAAADKALERGIGARGLRAVLEEVMTHTMYDVPSDPSISKVVITEKSVKDGEVPELIHDRDKEERPRLGGEVPKSTQGRMPARDTAS